MSVRRIVLWLALTAVAVPALVGFVSSQPSQIAAIPPIDQTPRQAATTTPIPESTQQPASSVSALGQVEANQIVDLYFQVAGTVSDVLVEKGSVVKAGDVLARLDSTDAQIAYGQATLNLENAQISLQKLSEPPSDEDLKVAQANLASAQAAYSSAANKVSPEDLQAAQVKYQQAQEEYAAQQQARTQMNGTDSQIALQEAKIGQAGFNAEIARLQLENLQTPNNGALWSAGAKVAQAELQLEQLQAGPTQSQLDDAQIALERAQAQLRDAQTTLDRQQLLAPISGVVTQVNVVQGQSVAPATLVIEIADLSQLWITAPINELDVDHLTEKMPVTIHLDALPGVDIPGILDQIAWLSTVNSDGIVTYDARIGLQTTDPRVRIGMTGEAIIHTGEGT